MPKVQLQETCSDFRKPEGESWRLGLFRNRLLVVGQPKENTPQMLKKIALALATLAILISAKPAHDVPQPTCGPCPSQQLVQNK